uniref:Uncharacterized protein n=1 Tax=Anguilla anguilla TaxID=7936 RepID=A0A0E9R3F8_ANGAN
MRTRIENGYVPQLVLVSTFKEIIVVNTVSSAQ